MKIRPILCAAMAMALMALAACGGTPAPEATETPAVTAAPTAAETQAPAPTEAAQSPEGAATDAELIAAAGEVLDAYFAADYEKLDGYGNDTLKQGVVSSGGWPAIVEQLDAQAGKMTQRGEATVVEAQGQKYVVLPIKYEKMTLNATLAFDAQGKLATFIFQPAQVDAPEAVVPEDVTEESVTVDAQTGYPLGGYISLPKAAEGKIPAVLLVWGSGANPRDEVIGANRVFAQVAYGLSQRGYLVLRFDKRTYAYPQVQAEAEYSVKDEYITDVLAAMKLLKEDPRVDASRVFLLGHSQGGMLAPRLQEAGAGAAGLILMAGTPRLLSDVLYDQEMDVMEAAQKQATTEEQKKAIETQKAQYDAWKAEADALYTLPEAEAKTHKDLYDGAFSAYYMYEMAKATQPIDLLLKNETPVLILQGERDRQVYAATDYKMYEDALKGKDYASFKLYPGLSHCFMPSTADSLPGTMEEYNKPMQIPAEVFDDMDAFMKGIK